MKARISKRAVDAAKPQNRDLFVWDTEVSGFGLKVTPAGRKVYILQARMPGQKRDTSPRRWTIGRHGSPWTPDAARDKAVKMLGLIVEGIDPKDHEAAAALDGFTVDDLCREYLEEGCRHKRALTVEVERGLVQRHVLPLLGKRRVVDLCRADIERFIANIAAGKTATVEKTKSRGRAVVKGGKGAANRTASLLSAILTFAVQRGYRRDNPAQRVKKYKLPPRERFLSSEEMARLGDVLTKAEAKENPFAIAAIRLLVLTGCRRNEVLSLRWNDVDVERQVIRLSDSKTGARPVHLGAAAVELLQSIPRVEGSPYVFPSSTGNGHIVGIQKIWARLREQAGLDDVRLHDLRHSYASAGAASGDSLFIIGKLLGHRRASTTERYAHLSADPLKAAADRISQEIDASMKGKRGADVVKLKEGA